MRFILATCEAIGLLCANSDATNEALEGTPISDLLKDAFGTFNTSIIVDEISTAISRHISTSSQITVNGKYFEVRIIPFEKSTEKNSGALLLLHDNTLISRANEEAVHARNQAESASKAKTAFLATMSHEIRTPLNAVIGLSESLLHGEKILNPRVEIEKIYTAGQTLLAIVNDILDISKIESGVFELHRRQYEMPSVLNDVINHNLVRKKEEVSFRCDISPTFPRELYGDDIRVRQIINNLLSNAFKYTDEGHVRLAVDWEPQGDSAKVLLTVEDTGRGVRQEDQEKLFTEYRQLDAEKNRAIEGTGLGLSIVSKLARLMDGGVSIRSEYGKGSVFSVHIRQYVVDADPIGEQTAESLVQRRLPVKIPSGRGFRRVPMPYGKVLAVDDQEMNLDVLRGLLLPYRLDVDFVRSGAEAVERIRAQEKTYDLVFMDHMMPEMNGIETTRRIREDIDSYYAKTVPIVALTAYAIRGSDELFLQSGFSDFLPKPIEIGKLDAILRKWIRERRPVEEVDAAESGEPLVGDEEARGVPDLPPVLLADIEGVDFRRRLDDYPDIEGFVEVLRTFVRCTPELLDTLRAKAEARDLGNYVIAVHGLKGSCLVIGAEKVAGLAKELEEAGKGGDMERILGENEGLVAMAEELVSRLKDLLESSGASRERREVRAWPDMAVLRRLLEGARQYRFNEMEDALKELLRYDYDQGRELVEWLEEKVGGIEYDEVEERLSRIRNLPEDLA
ncbi:MAG: response regulator [Desulfovibrio sp.]|nr:response regulator [Desulfovibrio sp.]